MKLTEQDISIHQSFAKSQKGLHVNILDQYIIQDAQIKQKID
jgi:hypothetical protein